MPQVQVALRQLAKGEPAGVNSVMSFIITAPPESTAATPSSNDSAAKRAYDFRDVLKPSSGLKPDVEWYLYKQILPPIERLCAPIDGTDAVRLAECLGLDTKKYAISSSSGGVPGAQEEISPLESQIPDNVRFKDASRLSLRCRACTHSFFFQGLAESMDTLTPEGIICPQPTCKTIMKTLTVVAQLDHAIRLHTTRYYDGWLLCDDSACATRTRSISVYGHRCLGPHGRATGCSGRMAYAYGERALYNQLLYFRGLWDVETAKSALARKTVGPEAVEKARALAEWNRERFETCRALVEGYLAKCGRVWVQMDSLFGFALKG